MSKLMYKRLVGQVGFTDAEHWITLHPNGKGNGKGQPALINGAGQIIGGAGGKLNGQFVKPKSKSAERRGTETQHAPAIWLGPAKPEETATPTKPARKPRAKPATKPTEKPAEVKPQAAAPVGQETPAPQAAQEKPGKRKPYAPAKTSKEAASWAVENDLVTHANYGKLHVEIANAQNESLHRHIEEFPALRANQQFAGSGQEFNKHRHEARRKAYVDLLITKHNYEPTRAEAIADRQVTKPKVPGNCWAFAAQNPSVKEGNGVAFNDKHTAKDLSNLKAKMAYAVANQWSPQGCDTLKSVFDHEYGHQLDYLLGLRKNQAVINLRQQVYGSGTYAEQRKRMKEEVCEYANENIAEFIAECWSEANNNPNPRPAAVKLAEIVRAEYARQHGPK